MSRTYYGNDLHPLFCRTIKKSSYYNCWNNFCLCNYCFFSVTTASLVTDPYKIREHLAPNAVYCPKNRNINCVNEDINDDSLYESVFIQRNFNGVLEKKLVENINNILVLRKFEVIDNRIKYLN